MKVRFLELEITDKCLLSCKHCYGDFPKKGELPKEKIEQIIDQARHDFDCLIFSGGEPFLHRNLIEALKHADKRGFSVHITTSGYKVPSKMIDELPDNAFLVYSLDGIGKVHDEYRGINGAYEELIESLEYTKMKLKFNEIVSILWKKNIEQLNELVRIAERYRSIIHFNSLIPSGRAKEERDIFLSTKEKEWVYHKIGELMHQHSFILTDLYKVTEKDRAQGIDLFCKGRYSIDTVGDVHPCEYMRWVTFGNVFEEKLPEIIERSRKTRFIQAREEGFKNHIPPDLPDSFDYHGQICHRLAERIRNSEE
jgi:MoaA/NifB/PqqE/SkfB family radical SAM enzyme